MDSRGLRTITVHKVNESTRFIECDETIAREMWHYFSAKAPNFRFHPLVKQGIWDGTLRYFDLKTNHLPAGLAEEVSKFAKDRYKVIRKDIQPDRMRVSNDEMLKFIESLDIPEELAPRDYQIKAVIDGINHRLLNMKSVTSSGKSMILYLFIRWMEKHSKKIILIVPNVGLVEQMFGDFESYGWDHVADKCHMIYAGQKKVFNCPVIISTWQSLYKDLSLFENFECLMIDEAHGANAKSLNSIAKASINAEWRIGCSGTFPDEKTAEWFGIIGALGPVIEYTTYKQLQDAGYIAKIKIFNMVLQYPRKVKKEIVELANGDYHKETVEILKQPLRNSVIAKMCKKFDQNALLLFTRIEHGLALKEILETELAGKKKVLYIDGSISGPERESIRKEMETRNDLILLASYGTFSTGSSVKNIHNLVFISGYKSRIKVLQSIGRALRKMAGKEYANLYDLIDDISCTIDGKKYTNHSMRHAKERIKIYEKEGFEYRTIKIELKEQQ